ncbi:rhamnogalacturonan acetylesterase like protein [Zymoseptoria brevis]|uniref:Rhamnogalacturonan acetylesterase like protein n=1 Tax=Zymoseptoria brevis TaxID=1047168 RepID=A0A0F4GK20_9PEZI|nr:rhamnogalacturonan acetylesterase like protein [Zymoseptoria brevis]
MAASTFAAAAPTVYLAGDSTMAATGNNDGTTAGWGAYLSTHISLAVVNHALGGRSARSFTREGHFDAIAALITNEDIVVIEFGHNDGGGLRIDNGRSDCPPSGTDYTVTCKSTFQGKAETVLTYEAYLINAANLFTSKGARVIISSATPDNPFDTGKFIYSPDRFNAYARDAAKVSGATFVDHGGYTADAFEKAGMKVVDGYYPKDHVHTSPEGAKVVASAFVDAVVAAGGPLKPYVI